MNVLNLLVGLNSVIVTFLVVNIFKPFIGSYAAKKGENLATKEDIAQLTKIAEGIKAEISDKVWDRQRQWEMRRDVVFDVIKDMNSLNFSLRSLLTEYIRNQNASDLDKASDDFELHKKTFESSKSLATLIAGKSLREALDNFSGAMLLMHATPKIGEFKKKWSQNQLDLDRKYEAVRVAARKELNISESDDPPVINYDALQIETAS